MPTPMTLDSKKIIFVIFSLSIVVTPNGMCRPLKVTLDGYVMGQMSKVRLKGSSRKVLEGEILLGRDSSRSFVHSSKVGGQRKTIQNPWLFCADGKLYDQIVEDIGNFVVLHFSSPKKSSLIQCTSNYSLVDLFPIDHLPMKSTSFQEKFSSKGNRGNSSVGTGRIVSAIESGKLSQSWEITLQQGNTGNDFLSMNINDNDLYFYAIQCLKSARVVKIFYVERFINTVRRGDYGRFIYKIELMDDL